MNYQNNRYDSNNVLKNNSRRILYVTVIVAALFVAVISGTFAYFQLSVSSNPGDVVGGVLDISASINGLQVAKISGTGANGDKLIPMDTNNAYDSATGDAINGNTSGAALINLALSNNCIDVNGYTACHVYKIDVKEAANAPRLLIDGTVSITGTKVNNLRFALINARSTTNVTSVSSQLNNAMNDTYFNGAVTYSSSNNNENPAILNFTNVDANNNNFLPANTLDNYYYIIIWLEDDGTNQTSENGGGSYNGTVTIAGRNGNTQRITATFSSGA